VIRIETTGGGGWGDPLERDAARVALDVLQGKVSRAAAGDDYGVVFRRDDGDPVVDQAATDELRARLAAERGRPAMFDRGPGYPVLAGGATHAEVDDADASTSTETTTATGASP
jgi:N-methylhydantoinase B